MSKHSVGLVVERIMCRAYFVCAVLGFSYFFLGSILGGAGKSNLNDVLGIILMVLGLPSLAFMLGWPVIYIVNALFTRVKRQSFLVAAITQLLLYLLSYVYFAHFANEVCINGQVAWYCAGEVLVTTFEGVVLSCVAGAAILGFVVFWTRPYSRDSK